MSILDIDNNVIQTDRIVNLDKERELITSFLEQYALATEVLSIPQSEQDKTAHLKPKLYRWVSCEDIKINSSGSFMPDHAIRTEQRSCTDVYLKLIDNQWIIVPFNYNYPVGIFNYYGDTFPDYIRFANGTSVCRIMTNKQVATNYGYYVPIEDSDAIGYE